MNADDPTIPGDDSGEEDLEDTQVRTSPGGVSPFDYEAVVEWVDHVEQKTIAQRVHDAIDAVIEPESAQKIEDEVIAWEGLAAAEVVAAVRGKPSDDLPDSIRALVDVTRKADDELISQARLAVQRVRESAALGELMATPAWQQRIDELLARLEPRSERRKKPRSRRSIIIRSVVVAFIVVFGWIGVLVGLQVMSGGQYDYRAETEDVMAQISSGRAAELWRDASPVLRLAMPESLFVDKATEINQIMGMFIEVERTIKAVRNDRPSGETGWVKVRLKFVNGTTNASFSYHRIDDRWRLFGYYIEYPEDLARAAKPSPETKAAKSAAPTEVIQLLKQILEDLRGGRVAEVYAKSSNLFKQSISLNHFIELVDRRTRAMGAYVRVLDITKSGQNSRANKAWITVVLEYDHKRTTGMFDFVDTDGSWRLRVFKVLIPMPETPRRPVTN